MNGLVVSILIASILFECHQVGGFAGLGRHQGSSTPNKPPTDETSRVRSELGSRGPKTNRKNIVHVSNFAYTSSVQIGHPPAVGDSVFVERVSAYQVGRTGFPRGN